MPKVVLVPGFTQTAVSWRGVTEIVADTCHVLALDVPPRDTFVQTANAIAARGRHAIYVGYSMGARLCLQLALEQPALVQGLVLISGSPGLADEQARAERRASDEALARAIEDDGVDAFLAQWLAQPMFSTVPADASGLAERHALSAEYLAHCLRVLGTGTMEPLWNRLGELAIPVALVSGRLDLKFTAIAEQMLQRIGSEVVHVQLDGGHALPLEQPAVVGGFIAAFAAQHG